MALPTPEVLGSVLIVRRFLLPILLACTGMLPSLAGDPPTSSDSTSVLQSFSGTGTTVTQSFQVGNKWEIRWRSPQVLSVTIYGADNKAVAGSMGVSCGSFYLASGGTYHLKIEGLKPPDTATDKTDTANADSTGHPVPPDLFFKWNVDVVQLDPVTNTSPQPQQAATDPASVPATTKLTDEQARAVVLIKGDNAQGTGFLVRTPDGPAVVTNLHVLGNNPNLKITTNSGELITMLSAKGAADRDIALLAIQDANYSYLDMCTDVAHTVQPGDEVITPGNSQGGGVVLNTIGKVLGVGPDRIEFDNPIYHGNSGGPVFHVKSNKVVGVVNEAMKVDISTDLDKASFASRNSAISNSMRYFGLRLDTVGNWVSFDWNRFQTERTFLDQFRLKSLSLDSFLNPPDPQAPLPAGQSPDDAQFFLKDKKIVAARNAYIQQATGNDGPQRIEALKELIFELNNIADTGLTEMQDPNNFYAFDQDRAKAEFAYRKAIKVELDSYASNVTRLNGIAKRGQE